jgi:hypothetical protein
MFPKSVNFGFFTKIYFCSSNSFGPMPVKFVNTALGAPRDYGIDLGSHYHFGWLNRRFVSYKEERLFGECSLRYFDIDHVQLEWRPSKLGFSQAVMFLDFNIILPEDIMLRQKISNGSIYSTDVILPHRTLDEVYFECLYMKDRTFTMLSPELI